MSFHNQRAEAGHHSTIFQVGRDFIYGTVLTKRGIAIVVAVGLVVVYMVVWQAARLNYRTTADRCLHALSDVLGSASETLSLELQIATGRSSPSNVRPPAWALFADRKNTVSVDCPMSDESFFPAQWIQTFYDTYEMVSKSWSTPVELASWQKEHHLLPSQLFIQYTNRMAVDLDRQRHEKPGALRSPVLIWWFVAH
ncbi:hypothetical protein [Nocardia sp. R7R-8]|uniref:hypothetical protein n=1 Tax=Nocardia sp. R7R-8 TaxID=3459304 RepID=UPI00403DDEEB